MPMCPRNTGPWCCLISDPYVLKSDGCSLALLLCSQKRHLHFTAFLVLENKSLQRTRILAATAVSGFPKVHHDAPWDQYTNAATLLLKLTSALYQWHTEHYFMYINFHALTIVILCIPLLPNKNQQISNNILKVKWKNVRWGGTRPRLPLAHQGSIWGSPRTDSSENGGGGNPGGGDVGWTPINGEVNQLYQCLK